jgi:RNA polymerase sigma-70 factor (ECF subfamily)
VRRSLAGDRAAANELVDRMICIPRFLRTFDARAPRPLGEQALADLEQEVAARVWRDRERFAGSSRLESWIYGYARRIHLEALGAERSLNERVTTLDADAFEQVDPAAPVDDAVAAQLDAQALRGVIDGLPDREREVVLAKLLTDASFTEIARARGEDVNAVKTRYYRTLERIKGLVAAGLHHREERR